MPRPMTPAAETTHDRGLQGAQSRPTKTRGGGGRSGERRHRQAANGSVAKSSRGRNTGSRLTTPEDHKPRGGGRRPLVATASRKGEQARTNNKAETKQQPKNGRAKTPTKRKPTEGGTEEDKKRPGGHAKKGEGQGGNEEKQMGKPTGPMPKAPSATNHRKPKTTGAQRGKRFHV